MLKKLKQIKQKFDTTAMAVAFAEAGEWKTAEQLMSELKHSTLSMQPKMLFASADHEFSPTVIEYAVNLASRMKLDILALNIFHPESDTFICSHGKSSNWKKRSRKFIEMQELLQKKAGELDIHCNQALLKDDMRNAITRISQFIRRVEVIIIQQNQERDPFLKLNIPVYLVAPGND